MLIQSHLTIDTKVGKIDVIILFSKIKIIMKISVIITYAIFRLATFI